MDVQHEESSAMSEVPHAPAVVQKPTAKRTTIGPSSNLDTLPDLTVKRTALNPVTPMIVDPYSIWNHVPGLSLDWSCQMTARSDLGLWGDQEASAMYNNAFSNVFNAINFALEIDL